MSTARETTALLRRHAVQDVDREAASEIDEAPISSWRRIVGIALALVGVFIAGADHSFLMVTYETIASHFDAVSYDAWILTGYNLGYCMALPAYGKISDMYGHKTPLAISYCLFSIGTFLSGTASHVWQMIAGRIITGLGGAGMVALVSVVITNRVLPNQVAFIRSFVSAVNISGQLFGGPLGAFVADAISWRWSFLIQTLIALFCGILFIALWSAPKPVVNQHDGYQALKPSTSTKADYFEIAGFAVIITSLLASIELFGKDEFVTASMLLFIALASGVVFMFFEAYYAERPLIPLSLIKTKSSLYFVIQMLLIFSYQAHASSLSPYFLWTSDIELTEAAMRIIPLPIGFMIGSVIAGIIIRRTNEYKYLCSTAAVLGLWVYMLIAARWGAAEQFSWEWLYSMPAGLSLGIVLACTFTGLTVSTEPSLHGTAICLYYLSQQVGSIIGTAVSTVAIHSAFRATLTGALQDLPRRDEVIWDIINRSGIRGIPQPLHESVRLSYLASFRLVSTIPIIATKLALTLVFFIPKVALK
ncbi:major facilitator superfamily domain-containing protein [Trichoderma evansii]